MALKLWHLFERVSRFVLLQLSEFQNVKGNNRDLTHQDQVCICDEFRNDECLNISYHLMINKACCY